MKVGCCGLGIFGMIARAIGKVLELIVAIIVYLGLYWPMFYLIVVFCLWMWGGMTFDPSVELALFYVGLIISLMCSIVLTLRHLIFEPFGKYLDRKQEEKEVKLAKMREKNERKRQAEIEKARRANRSRYEERRGNPPPPPNNRRYDNYSYRSRREDRESRPYVYRSERDRSLIIYEFRDRFEVYREGERGLRHIDTKWK